MSTDQPTPTIPSPRQRILGSNGLVVLIALLSAFVPLSTDLYLPALPKMSQYFGVAVDQINLTLTLFFIFYSVGTLFWGPLSDRYGRKPILLIGLVVYGAASVMCATTRDVTGLIIYRSLQAIGGSAAGAVATAVVKDVYAGRKRESVLAIVQSMTLISPAVAPVLGALLMGITSWRGIFWVLSGIGFIALIGSLCYEETIQERNEGHVFESLSRLGKVLQNRGFSGLLLIFSIGSISSLAFIASSTYIYQNGFHLSSQVYSAYFSFCALGMIAGPMIYLRLSRKLSPITIIRGCYFAIAASGLLVCLFGSLLPWVFTLCIFPSLIANNCLRPPSANLMLEQQTGDTGSVSSVMGCAGLLMGSLGMQLISLDWGNTILALGIMTCATAVVSLVFWPLATRHMRLEPAGGQPALETGED